VQSYLEAGYVSGKRIGKNGLRAELYAVTSLQFGELSYIKDFVEDSEAGRFQPFEKSSRTQKFQYLWDASELFNIQLCFSDLTL